jgi:hypothetical protein
MNRRHSDPDPGTPHEFRQIDDPGMGAFAAGGGSVTQGFGSVVPIAMTDNFVRKSHCGVPGCGKDRSSPIHHGGEA